MKKLLVVTLVLALFMATSVVSVAGGLGKHRFSPPSGEIDPEDISESYGNYGCGVPGDSPDWEGQGEFKPAEGKHRF